MNDDEKPAPEVEQSAKPQESVEEFCRRLGIKLAEADPFDPFTIRMFNGNKCRITKKELIEFTHYGSPKVWAPTSKHGLETGPSRWHILSVEAISEIIL